MRIYLALERILAFFCERMGNKVVPWQNAGIKLLIIVCRTYYEMMKQGHLEAYVGTLRLNMKKASHDPRCYEYFLCEYESKYPIFNFTPNCGSYFAIPQNGRYWLNLSTYTIYYISYGMASHSRFLVIVSSRIFASVAFTSGEYRDSSGCCCRFNLT